jgi:tetratricopeptide (TPR) repeat protein
LRLIHRMLFLAAAAPVGLSALVAPLSPAQAQVVSQPQPETDRPDSTVEPSKPPPLAPGVKALLDQDYLSDTEKRALRIKHGLWENGDLADPALKARAAVIRGAFADPALDESGASPLDRADARLRRGDPQAALDLLKDDTSLRGARIRAQSLVDLGRTDEALAVLEPLVQRVAGKDIADADELTEGVRALVLRSRLAGADPHGDDYRAMLAMLARAREDLDRFSWNATLAEAQLLFDKDAFDQMGQALEATLALNPRCADAWYLAAMAAADSYDFERAESMAARLDELASPQPSPYGAVIRAMIRVKQGDADAAEQALDVARAKFPSQRDVMVQWVAAAARRFDFEETKRRLDAFDALAPNSPLAYLAVGKAMASARQYDEAARYLRVASERAPKWPIPVIELGLSEMQSGNNAAALADLGRAQTLDTINVRAANSLVLLKELATYTSKESDHFIVRCKPGVDEILAAEMLPQLEKIYTRVTGNGTGGIDHKPQGKTVVEVYPTHRWFGVRITGLPALHTIAAATGPLIAMEVPREGPGHLGAYNWARVVQHEYTHTVTLSRTKNRLPHWFTEASAVYLEDCPRDTTTVELLASAYKNNGLFDLDSINLGFIRPKRPTDRQLAYAQGHWMYEFIIEHYGADKPLELMDLYATGVREGPAFQKVLGVSRDEFLEQFKLYARDQLVAWGMLPSAGNPDIKELMREEGKLDAEDDDTPSVPKGPTDELIQKWLKKYPTDPFVLAAAVKSKMARQHNKATVADIELIERYAAARPMDVLPHKLLAALYLSGAAADKGRAPDAAIEHLEYLDAREQHSPAYAIELSRQYAAVGDLDKAAAKAERATQISPYDATYREHAATIALRRKDYATAERHINALIALEPDREVHKQRLEALKKLKEPAKR